MTTDLKTTKKRYPLHWYLATLTTLVVLLAGLPATLLNYEQDSKLIYKHAETILDISTERLATRFREKHDAIGSSLRLLSKSDLLDGNDWEQRSKHLEIWMRMVGDEESLSGLTIAYPNGEFILVRDAQDWMGDDAGDFAYVIDHGVSLGDLQRHYYNEDMELVTSEDIGITQFNTLDRPWYTDATTIGTDTIVTTAPYQFYFYQLPGITLAYFDSKTNVVIAADLTLELLSETFSDLQLGPSTISLLVDNRDKILAINKKHILEQEEAQYDEIPNIEHLPNNMLVYIKELLSEDNIRSLSIGGESWYGSNRKVELYDGITAQLILATPQEQLVAGAINQRSRNLLLMVLLIAISLPISWFAARYLSRPINRLAAETQQLSELNFDTPIKTGHRMAEIEQLAQSMSRMQKTINHFFKMINSLAGESNVDNLRERILDETLLACDMDAANLFFLSEDEQTLIPQQLLLANHKDTTVDLLNVSIDGDSLVASALRKEETSITTIEMKQSSSEQLKRIQPVFDALDCEKIMLISIPLRNRDKKGIGVLNLIRRLDNGDTLDIDPAQLAFAEAISGFAAVTLETHELLAAQKLLLNSFIKLIAAAIDSKSPYTGAHCERVPELAKLLAQAACEQEQGPFAQFSLDEQEWEALHIASWLHDCGKVTTPEYVVDKATKLETIYNRLHEIRMRFELLKMQAHRDYWQQLHEGGNEAQLAASLDTLLQTLDEEFEFVANCNTGSEFMADDKIEKLQNIGSRQWLRTIDSTMGLSETEVRTDNTDLPVWEPLLADRPEHIIAHISEDHTADPEFTMKAPEALYNLGEIYNLSIQRGTLTAEERFKINDHIIQTIIMLKKLPLPKHLKCVPEIAGGHHEKMDGTGYPRGLEQSQLSLQARMLAVADIFEALTASDRPYKKAKNLSGSLKIMSFMVKDRHIDKELFQLFLESGAYMTYANKHMNKEQIDEVDIAALIATINA